MVKRKALGEPGSDYPGNSHGTCFEGTANSSDACFQPRADLLVQLFQMSRRVSTQTDFVGVLFVALFVALFVVFLGYNSLRIDLLLNKVLL